MKFRSIAALSALSVALSACVSGSDSTPASSGPTAGFQAQFNPDFGILPFPNDLYFNGSTTGQLNIPGDATVAANGPLLELNHLDGFGTQSDISVYFTAPIDGTSISAADVIVLKVASSVTTKAVNPSGTVTPLVFGKDYTAVVSPGTDVNGSVLTIKPLKPLAGSTITGGTTPLPSTYLVIVTNGLKDTSGHAATPSADFAKVLAADLPVLTGGKMGTTGDPTLDQVALFTLPQLAVAAGAKVNPTTIAVTFSFSTEYLGVALGAVAATAATVTPPAQPTGVGIVDTGKTVCQILVASGQLASASACAGVPGSTVTEVFAGTVALPYYLTVPATGSTVALTDAWHNAAGGDIALSATNPTSFVPKATVTQNVIPIIAALPMAASGCTMPGGGWPVTIFQHGITRNREDVFAIASALSVGGAPTLCTAVLAIDLPLHGVTNTSDPFYRNQLFTGTAAATILTVTPTDLTFDMDANGVAGATGSSIGGSGAQFINLASTITSRDNLREGAADLINLVAALPNMHAISPPATVNTFDKTKVFFVGHSLGGIEGTVFLGADTEGAALTVSAPKIKAAVLGMPGGHVAELLRLSPSFEPVIDAGLAKQGLVKGTQSYYDFYSQAQAVVEDGDPGNYAALAAQGHPLHMIEVVGGADASSLPDQVVPNSATDVLIGQMGITSTITATHALAVAAPTLVQFTTGGHGSILSPAAPSGASSTVQAEFGAVTVEMQSETASVIFHTLAGAPSVAVSSSTFLSATLKP